MHGSVPSTSVKFFFFYEKLLVCHLVK